jgi:hypothetical protein
VGDPADEEVEGPGLIDVFRLEGDIADEVAGVVEGHEDNGEAANEVNRGYAVIASIGGLEVGVWNGELRLLLRFGEFYWLADGSRDYRMVCVADYKTYNSNK